MRELKFRAWHKDNYIELNDLRGNKSIYFSPYDLGFITQSIDRKEVELEQYTGLKDKNGKEIYEGDILKADDGNDLKYYPTLTAVKWSDVCSGFIPFADYDRDCNIWYVEEYCEVIGNIHENPELLEQEDAKN